jgi:hypothetical protein
VKTNRLLMAMTFMSILLFGPSLFAQQEVDPTWYDPWAAPNKVSAPATQPPAAQRKHQPKMVSGLPKGNSAKVRAKRSVSRRTLSQTDLAVSCHSPRNWSIGVTAFSPRNEDALYCSGFGGPALNAARPMGRVDPPLEV